MTRLLSIGPQSAVRSLIGDPPLYLQGRCPVRIAAQAMRDAGVSVALVDGGRAIVTERDLARGLAAGVGSDAPLSAVCTEDPVTIVGDATILAAAHQMLDREVRHLVVRDRFGPLVGVLSFRDVMGVLTESVDPAVWEAALRQAITGRAESWFD